MARKEKHTRPQPGPEIPAPQGFHLMAKPAGPDCNLHCQYCFYLEKAAFFPDGLAHRMSDEVLEAYTRKYIAAQPGPSVTFAWQGGEPTLLGIEFFQRALALQKKYNPGQQITNTLQTNGTLIDEAWCRFLSENNFLVGLSLDGPAGLHDAFRVDRAGRPTMARVLAALKLMQSHGVEVNVIAAVNRQSSRHPLEVYDFFKQQGVQYIQFLPIVERQAGPEARKLGLPLGVPPILTELEPENQVTPWTVEPQEYSQFLIRIFDAWIKSDIGKVFVMNFEWTLGAWLGAAPGVCYLARRCGLNPIIEHNGDVYSCDHFMYPAYRLGSILADDLGKMIQSSPQSALGAAKETALPRCCRDCKYLLACHGGCPKQRFMETPDGEPGLNYLCPGLIKFFDHVNPYMNHMVNLIRRGQPVKF